MTVARAVPAWAAELLAAAGRRCDGRGWLPATAGNFSVRLDAERVAITQSGRRKGSLAAGDVMAIGLDGGNLSPGRPSADTPLHLALYRRNSAIGAVVHGHSVAATVLSREAGAAITFRGYELQKLFAGAPDPEALVQFAIFDNDPDNSRLAQRIDAAIDPATAPGYVLRGHGVYIWGGSMEQALARLEAIEFILACELELSRRAR